MKRVLVITDNSSLLNSFIKVTNEQQLLSDAVFDYRYSAKNRAPEALALVGCRPIAVGQAVDWIISNFDLVFSIHCKQIFPPHLVLGIPCYNVHPGLNPHNRGWYPQVFSIINKKPIGATIHLMNEEIDAGPIVAQEPVSITALDTSLSLYQKVQNAETMLLERYLRPIILGELPKLVAPTQGNFNSMEEFRALCQLDKSSIGSLQEHIDLLRALTHGNYNNAYFIDEMGRKVFVKISLSTNDG